MFTIIKQLLSTGDFYGESELIEIAKGKYKKADTVRYALEQGKREIKWVLRNKSKKQ